MSAPLLFVSIYILARSVFPDPPNHEANAIASTPPPRPPMRTTITTQKPDLPQDVFPPTRPRCTGPPSPMLSDEGEMNRECGRTELIIRNKIITTRAKDLSHLVVAGVTRSRCVRTHIRRQCSSRLIMAGIWQGEKGAKMFSVVYGTND